jgi:hypothetical protein
MPNASIGEISAALDMNGLVTFPSPILGLACVGGKEPIERVTTFTKTEGENTCTIKVHFTPNFYLEKVSGTCTLEDKKSLDELLMGDAAGTASLMQKGWFSWHASPGHYCYCNPVTKEYQCYYW